MGCFQMNSKELSYKVHLLDETELVLLSSPSRRGRDLLDQVFSHLNLVEIEYFGLRFHDPEENLLLWLDEEKPLYKQLKPNSASTTSSSSSSSSSSINLFFAVRFYVSDPAKLAEEVTRYQFYRQLRRDVAQGKIAVSRELAAQLGSLILQAELGNFDAANHGVDYAGAFRIVPNQTEELSTAMMQLHSTCSGQSTPVAEMIFLNKVKWVVDYGVERHKVLGDGNISYHLGLVPTGILVMRNDTRVGNYLWPRVLKLDYKRERFVLKVRDKSLKENVFAFNAKSKAAAKHLWKCASTQRDFFTSTRIENPMVAHRLMAGVSSAPVRKSKYVLPPANHKSRISGGGHKAAAAAGASSPRSGVEDLNSNSIVKGDLLPTSPPLMEKIRASSPTSIVDGIRQKSDRHSIASSPDKNPSFRREDAANGDDGGGGGVQMLAATGGLFTAAGGSPLSTRSSHSSRYRRRPQSESEYSHKMGHNNNSIHRSRKSTAAAGAGVIDNDGVGAIVERKQRKKSRGNRNSRGDGESGSDGSKKSRGSRGRNHQNKNRHSQDVMVDSGTQWAKVQQQQQRRQNEGDKENVSSVQDAGESDQKNPLQHKKYRTRSKSPKISKTALPPEIIQHIHHDLVDPRGFSDEQLRDIPFTSVETQQRPRRISPHARAGRTAINAAVFQGGGGAAAALTPRHPGDGAEIQPVTPVYRPGFANAASVKTGLVNQVCSTDAAPVGSPKSLGQLKDEMSQQLQQQKLNQRPKDWRQQLQQQQQQQRGEIGAVPTSGGGAFYFPNGIPSGYFSDATCNDVWADDEMEADM